MNRGYVNVKAIIVLLIAIAIVVPTAIGLRQWQLARMHEQALSRGLDAYQQNQWETAATQLGRYLQMHMADQDILLKYAQSNLNIRPATPDTIRQAIAAYRRLLRSHPDNTTAAENLISIYLNMHLYGEAELIAQRHLRTNSNVDIRRMLAVAQAQQRKFEPAITNLHHLISEYPDHVSAYEVLARILEQHPELSASEPQSWLDRAVENNPDSALAYIIRGSFAMRNRNTEAALEDFAIAEDKQFTCPTHRLRLAEEYIRANMHSQAKEQLDHVYRTEPTNQRLWQKLAQLALQDDDPDQIRQLAQAGLRTLADDPWDFMPLAAELYVNCDELEKAQQILQRLESRQLNPGLTAYMRGIIAERQEDIPAAINHWHEAAARQYQLEKTRMALARAYVISGNLSSAIAQLRTLSSEQPSSIEAQTALASVLNMAGHHTEAASIARAAMRNAPGNIDAAATSIRANMQLARQQSRRQRQLMLRQTKDHIESLMAANQHDPQVMLIKFELLLLEEDFQAAEQLLDELQQTQAEPYKIQMAQIELLSASEQHAEAIARLQQLHREFPARVEPVEHLTTLLVRHTDPDQCEAKLRELLYSAEYPYPKQRIAIALAGFYEKQGRVDYSKNIMEALISLYPDEIRLKRSMLNLPSIRQDKPYAQQIIDNIRQLEGSDGWQWRLEQARLWFESDDFQNRYVQIVDMLQANLRANPQDQNSRLLLGRTYEKAGKAQLAAMTYQEALQRSPNDVNIIVPAISALYEARQYEQAQALLNRLSAGQFSNPALAQIELQNSIRQGRLDTAEKILQDLTEQDPDQTEVKLALALLKIQQQQYNNAERILQQLIYDQPTDLTINSALVELNIRQQRMETAVAVCDAFVDKTQSASAYLLRGQTLLRLSITDQARRDYRRAIELEPENPTVWIAKSFFERALGNFDQSLELIETAGRLDPHDSGIKKLKVTALLSATRHDRFSMIADILKDALAEQPDDIEWRLLQARFLMPQHSSESLAQAQSILIDIISSEPAAATAWVLLSENYITLNRPGQALDVIEQALTYMPENTQLLLAKAKAQAQRSPAQAVTTLRKLQEKHPQDVEIVLQLANAYIEAQRGQDSVDLLVHIVENCVHCDPVRIKLALATAYQNVGNLDQARQLLEQLYRSNPNDRKVFLAAADMLLSEEQPEQVLDLTDSWLIVNPGNTEPVVELARRIMPDDHVMAEAILTIALDRQPESESAMQNLAQLLQHRGRNDEAIKLYDKILTANPQNVIAANNQAWLLSNDNGKHERALKLAKQAMTVAPDYADLIDTKGYIHLQLGQYEQAIADFQKCIDLHHEDSPARTLSYYHLGKALQAADQHDRAAQNLRRALRLNAELGGLSTEQIDTAQTILAELSTYTPTHAIQ